MTNVIRGGGVFMMTMTMTVTMLLVVVAVVTASPRPPPRDRFTAVNTRPLEAAAAVFAGVPVTLRLQTSEAGRRVPVTLAEMETRRAADEAALLAGAGLTTTAATAAAATFTYGGQGTVFVRCATNDVAAAIAAAVTAHGRGALDIVAVERQQTYRAMGDVVGAAATTTTRRARQARQAAQKQRAGTTTRTADPNDDPDALFLDDAGLDGAGEIVAVVDTGVDFDNCAFATPGVEARVANVPWNAFRPSAPRVISYMHWRGAWCAATAATPCGDRIDGGGQGTAVASRVVRRAPAVKLAIADLHDDDGAAAAGDVRAITPPSNAHEGLLAVLARQGARVVVLGWGCSGTRAQCNDYGTLAREIDQAVHALDDVVVIVAAGDTGDASGTNGTLVQPGTAKNVLTVGALDAPFSGTGPPWSNGMPPSSPARARIKPDLVAPGIDIDVAASDGRLWQQQQPPPSSSAVCDPTTATVTGTAVAAAHVAADAALVRQFLRRTRNHTVVPAALVRAVLVTAAADATTAAAPDPNHRTGFGRPALRTTLPFLYIDSHADRTRLANTSTVVTYTFRRGGGGGASPPAPSNLVVTLAWSDPVGHDDDPDTGDVLRNDLDLVCRLDTTLFRPNGRAPADGPDTVNTLERVVVPPDALTAAPPTSDVTCTVSAASLAIQGPPQRFALAARGVWDAVDVRVGLPSQS